MACAFGLALAVRLLFVFQWQATPYANWPLLDADAYHEWAKIIASGELFRPRAFYQSPLYPYLLGFLYAVFGASALVAGLWGALLDALTVTLLTHFTFKHFGRTAAIATALLAIFFRPMIFYSAPVMKEPLVLFLLAALLPFAFSALHDNKRKAFALSGLLIGLGALTRGNLLLLAPALGLFALYKHRTTAIGHVVVLALTTALAIAPATLHNAYVSNDFVPINYADGFNLYIGHSPIANGTNAYPPEVSTDPVQEEFNTSYIAQQAMGHDLKPSEVSSYWRTRAVQEIKADPWRELSLLTNKIEAFWNSTDTFDNYDIPFIAKNFDTLLSWPLVGFGLISTLAAFAAWPALKQKNEAAQLLLVLLGVYFLSVMPFYVTDRYRLPVIIFLLPLAGAAFAYAPALFKGKTKPFAACGLALLFAFLSLKPNPTPRDLTAFDWGTLTAVYAGQERDEDALNALEKGLALAPTEVGPQAFLQAATSAKKLGQSERAAALLAQALQLYPENGTVHYNIGRDLAAEGKLPEAIKAFERALKLNPSYTLTYYALAVIHDKLGHYEQASSYAAQGLAIDPTNRWLWGFVTHRGP